MKPQISRRVDRKILFECYNNTTSWTRHKHGNMGALRMGIFMDDKHSIGDLTDLRSQVIKRAEAFRTCAIWWLLAKKISRWVAFMSDTTSSSHMVCTIIMNFASFAGPLLKMLSACYLYHSIANLIAGMLEISREHFPRIQL